MRLRFRTARGDSNEKESISERPPFFTPHSIKRDCVSHQDARDDRTRIYPTLADPGPPLSLSLSLSLSVMMTRARAFSFEKRVAHLSARFQASIHNKCFALTWQALDAVVRDARATCLLKRPAARVAERRDERGERPTASARVQAGRGLRGSTALSLDLLAVIGLVACMFLAFVGIRAGRRARGRLKKRTQRLEQQPQRLEEDASQLDRPMMSGCELQEAENMLAFLDEGDSDEDCDETREARASHDQVACATTATRERSLFEDAPLPLAARVFILVIRVSPRTSLSPFL